MKHRIDFSKFKEILQGLSHKTQVSFAIHCAKDCLHLIDTKNKAVAEKYIATIEAWLLGNVTAVEYHDISRLFYNSDNVLSNFAFRAIFETTHSAAISMISHSAVFSASAVCSAACAHAYAHDDRRTREKKLKEYYEVLLSHQTDFERACYSC